MTLTLNQGKSIVGHARAVIKSHFGGNKPVTPNVLKKTFTQERGVFVTLERYPENELRGCIGFPEPTLPLGVAIEDSAISAAFRDSRFPPLDETELDSITVEVSVLTVPKVINVDDPRDYVKEVKIGRDGLIIREGYFSGLLLPQVPVEWKWDIEEFLAHTCQKAGLSPDMWLTKEVIIYRFQAQIFSEVEPRGNIVEKEIMKP